MADISLIPKDYKKGLSIEAIFSKIGIFVFALVIIGLLIYGGLVFYNKSLVKDIKETENKIKELNDQKDKDFEKGAVSLDKALNSLKNILKNHLYWSNVFSKFEKTTVPQVVFSNFSGSINQDGSVALSLNGKTSGYTYLAKQMVSFGQEKMVSGIELSGISISSQGGIEFVLNINFSKDILLK